MTAFFRRFRPNMAIQDIPRRSWISKLTSYTVFGSDKCFLSFHNSYFWGWHMMQTGILARICLSSHARGWASVARALQVVRVMSRQGFLVAWRCPNHLSYTRQAKRHTNAHYIAVCRPGRSMSKKMMESGGRKGDTICGDGRRKKHSTRPSSAQGKLQR